MSEVKVNKISPRTNCGTVQLGDSGDTITIPAGATITNSGTASGFGATGSASWTTTVKTGDFTAVAGEGYFVNTTSGAITVTLPAGTAGDVVAIKDYANTFDTNAVTLVQNGSDKIGGSTDNSILSTEGIAVTLVFIDSTQGWLVTDSGLQSEAPGPEFITATGGTITTVCTNFKVHTFTGPGTFTVCSVGNSAGSSTIDYLVVAGGGGGGTQSGGGGGAGGMRFSACTYTSPSPLKGTALPVAATGYPITIGAGGAGGAAGAGNPNSNKGASGNPSTFAGSSTILSTGGGGGGANGSSAGLAGGSGGGGAICAGAGGAGNTPPVSPSQGNAGGQGGNQAVPCQPSDYGGSGGGAGEPGRGGPGLPNPSPVAGGDGIQILINGSNTYYAGGGGGGQHPAGPPAAGGQGGGGNGGIGPGNSGITAGTANTGGGGGGSGEWNVAGSAGGSGVVIIRYKFQ